MFKEYVDNKHTITLTARSKLLCRPTFILRLCRQLSLFRRKMKVSLTAIFNGICLAFYKMNRMFVLCIMLTIMSCYNSRVTLDCVCEIMNLGQYLNNLVAVFPSSYLTCRGLFNA